MTTKNREEKIYDVRPEFRDQNNTVFNAAFYKVKATPLKKSVRKNNFYKIALTGSECLLHFADKTIHINQPCLIFSSPFTSYGYEGLSEERSGYWCIFRDEFFKPSERTKLLQESPLFKIGSENIFQLDPQKTIEISQIFDLIIKDLNSDYKHKLDEIKTYVNLLVHQAMKLNPYSGEPETASTSRIPNLFLELLESQFPVDATAGALQLKMPSDYAEVLNLHVNYLNHVVKLITGKSTGAHIADRIVNEAKSLLKHSELSIAEIAYNLGFEYSNHFNHFFKKNTGITPLTYRKKLKDFTL